MHNMFVLTFQTIKFPFLPFFLLPLAFLSPLKPFLSSLPFIKPHLTTPNKTSSCSRVSHKWITGLPFQPTTSTFAMPLHLSIHALIPVISSVIGPIFQSCRLVKIPFEPPYTLVATLSFPFTAGSCCFPYENVCLAHAVRSMMAKENNARKGFFPCLPFKRKGVCLKMVVVREDVGVLD